MLRVDHKDSSLQLADLFSDAEESLHYQYTVNDSVQSRLLTDLLQHLVTVTRSLLHQIPESLHSKSKPLVHHCLKTMARGLVEYRGKKPRKLSSLSRRLREAIPRTESSADVEAILDEVTEALEPLPVH